MSEIHTYSCLTPKPIYPVLYDPAEGAGRKFQRGEEVQAMCLLKKGEVLFMPDVRSGW